MESVASNNTQARTAPSSPAGTRSRFKNTRARLFVLDECRDLLEETGQTVHDERYEDIILQALPPEYERVRTASDERRDFGLDDIRHIIRTMYVDNRSRSVNAKPVEGRDIAMQVDAGGGAH